MMPPDPSAQRAEAERAELECVIRALARWPRLSELLRYMGDKLLSGGVDQINEYNIATEVLGRSKTSFDAAEDAIARVETHRLRKRLAEFYKSEGISHSVQVTLPPGSYVPVFVSKPEEDSAPAPQVPETESAPDLQQKRGQPFLDLTSPSGYWILAGCLLAVAMGAVLYFQLGRSRPDQAHGGSNELAPASAAQPVQPGSSSAPIRLLAGYSGPPRIDSAGNVWSPDRYYIAGGTWQRGSGFTARTSDPFLFEHSRNGDFSYRIPLQPGIYELHLFFSAANSDVVATFNVSINGQSILEGFDINMDAMGADIGDERVFRNVSPDKDGFLTIAFMGAMAPPSLNAIEILPGMLHTQIPIRLIMQTSPVTDSKGQLWHPDNYFMNGKLSTQTPPLADSADPDLFSGERYGHFTYAIPVDTRDTYTLVLHFAEFYFHAPASSRAGRLFKVMCNGQTLLDNFDIYKEAGGLREVAKSFHHLKPSPQGKLNLTFEPIENNATVSGIEVLDESQ